VDKFGSLLGEEGTPSYRDEAVLELARELREKYFSYFLVAA
jgi:hypothetical protein